MRREPAVDRQVEADHEARGRAAQAQHSGSDRSARPRRPIDCCFMISAIVAFPNLEAKRENKVLLARHDRAKFVVALECAPSAGQADC
jgi:hypothetical protein